MFVIFDWNALNVIFEGNFFSSMSPAYLTSTYQFIGSSHRLFLQYFLEMVFDSMMLYPD